MVVLLTVGTTCAQKVDVQEVHLDNGMTVLMVPRKGDPNVAAGWVARVGSVNERPGITGISHLFEHMMFKGTETIGTKDYKKDLEILAEQEKVRDEMRTMCFRLYARVVPAFCIWLPSTHVPFQI